MGFLLSRWVLSFIGAALLGALVWLFGPLLAVLEGVWPRAAIIAAILLVWAAVNLVIGRRRARADDALVAGAAGPSAAEAASAEEVAALGEKLAAALTTLKKARGTRGYLYEQPWYVIIGPPGAGKTTALLNAGLSFPLAADMGQAAVAGVGGTRLCDWWFTDSAVLIDTAGRYTTQDSDAGVDRAGWEGFLDLLRRTRPRQPLNGVIVAISVGDIATAPPAERVAHARAIRKRIKELTERLGVRIPVYAVFTKADLLAGFTEFFDDLDRDRRAQVWGVTFPLVAGGASPLGGFGAAFAALVERLNARLLDRLQAERSPERRGLIAGLPAQVASLEPPLTGFLQEAFGGSRLDPPLFLRGVYLTSGTQEGTPIDRLAGTLARTFGLDQRRAPSLRPQQGRSYFLGRLLSEVVFGEAMLVSEKPGAARRRVLVRAASFAAVAAAVLGLGAALWRGQSGAAAEIDRTGAALSALEATAKTLPLDPVAGADLPRVLPLLDAARALPHGVDTAAADAQGWGFGLSQDDKLEAGTRATYRHTLERVLLPRLLWRLEAQIRANLGRPDYAYEATRVYLMLGRAGPLDPALVKAWMALDWQATWPGAGAAPLREALGRHLAALLENPLPQVPLDGALVEDARRTFSRVKLSERVYSRLRAMAAAKGTPPWRPADAAGASGVRLFMRASGAPLTDGVPGLYTVEGFHRAVLPALPAAAKEVAGESWVLGTRAELDPASPRLRDLESEVVALYTAEYAQVWDALLADLDVVPLRSLPQAVQDLYVLSSPQSPMRDLLAGLARQLTLSVPPPSPAGVAGAAKGVVAAAADAAQQAVAGATERLGGLVGIAAAGGPPPGFAIDERYKALRDFVGSGPGAPIDMVLKLLSDLQAQLNRLASTPAGASTAPAIATGDDPARLLQAEAQRQPQPVARWLQAIAATGTTLRGSGARQQIAAAFSGGGGPADLCQRAVAGRYPFSPGAANDIPLDDLARLFAPGGLLDAFFTAQVRPFVDTSGQTWRPQAVDGVASPVSAADVAQFQRAAAIRDLFFAAGGNQPTVRFDITPVDLDSGATQVTLDFDGTAVVYAHGPSRATQITWPGPTRMTTVRLVFDPPPAGRPAALQGTGPWALFRLFGQGSLQRAGGPERYLLTFREGERMAQFELRAGSVLNPFAPGVLQDFRCPVLR